MNFAKIVESFRPSGCESNNATNSLLPILWGLSSNVVIPFLRIFQDL